MILRRTSIGVFCALITAVQANAQRPVRCATPVHDANAAIDEIPSDCGYTRTNPTAEYATTSVYRIPVVFHVIQRTNGTGFLSQAQIQSQVDVLNEDFRAKPGSPGAPGFDTGIEFYLADVDPQGQPTNGITYTSNNSWFSDFGSYWTTLAWDTNRYLNIYTNSGGGALGYVPEIPQAEGLVGSARDRVVVLWNTVGKNAPGGPPFDQGRTVTHEVGHYLGLVHTFENGCGSASACYTTGDLICDTNREANPTNGCGRNKSSCSSPDPVNNYMDYSDDRCLWEFTSEQARRMRCTLKNYRPNLATECDIASSVSRNTSNPQTYTAAPPRLGENFSATVDPTTTGHDSALLFGFTGAGQSRLGGYDLLVDLGSTTVFVLGPTPGPNATFSFPIPVLQALCGYSIATQGAHLGGNPGFALTNAQDMVFGR